MFVPFAVSAKKAQPQAQIQSQAFVYPPVVLEIGLHDFVAIIVLEDRAPLLVTGNISQQQVSERVSRTDGGARAEAQDAGVHQRGRPEPAGGGQLCRDLR